MATKLSRVRMAERKKSKKAEPVNDTASEAVNEVVTEGVKDPEGSAKGMDKSVFLYMEPKGDTPNFGQCGSCWKFTGNSCLEFSPDFKVDAEDSCGLYVEGLPIPEMKGKETGGTTPEVAGFIHGPVRCGGCEYYEKADSDCLLFRLINIKDYKVHKHGCCNAFSSKKKNLSDGKEIHGDQSQA